jgi:hypothetical protein
MNTIDQNDDIECDVCRDEKPVYIPLITCAHSYSFCEKCIKKWLAKGHSTCPKCRAILSIRNYVS